MTEIRLNFVAVLHVEDVEQIRRMHRVEGLRLLKPDGGALHLNDSAPALVTEVLQLAVTGRLLLDLIVDDPTLTGEQLLERATREPVEARTTN